MALIIKTTGVEDYVDGSGNIKALIIGGPDTGKTRSSSFWPKPIYADTENGRASIADRNVPYAEVKSSQDMLDFLAHLKNLERVPKADRQYQTVIVDTLDGFQRKVKDEWLLQNKGAQAFRGYDAWGYLESKTSMLMTRLLNLDYNVLCLVHWKLKGSEDEGQQIVLQLQGDVKDQAFNDFDLVGWMGTFYEADNGERVEKRGITFKKTSDRPFLKDRTGTMPAFLPIQFAETDYTQLVDAIRTRMAGLSSGEVVEEIPSASADATVPSANVVAPTGGPLPPQAAREVPLHQYDKPTLVKMCRDEGVTTTIDGQPIKGNTLKGELVQALEMQRAKKAQEAAAPTESDATSASPVVADEAQALTPADVAAALQEQRQAEPEPDAPATPVEAAPVVETPQVEVTVDTATGEIAPSEPVGDVQTASVAEVPSQPAPVEDTPVPVETAAAPEAPAVSAGPACEQDGCDVDLTTQNADYVRLSFIRFKKKLCGTHYQEARAKAQQG